MRANLVVVTLPSGAPDLRALDVFVTVVELGSLSKAARAHGISQPSASNRVRGLERHLGLCLLERSTTGSIPTAAGALVAGWAGSVLHSMHELHAGVEALKDRRAGQLRIAASLTIAEYLLPSWLEEFLRNRPDDSITLEVLNSEAVLERLRGRHVELGFIESSADTPDMHQQIVATDELVVVVGPQHPWAQRDSVSIDELVHTPLASREPGSGTRESLETAVVALGHRPPVSALELGSTAAVRAAVVAGHLPTVLSERAVCSDLHAGSLVRVRVDGLIIHRELRALWPIDRPRRPLVGQLLARLPGGERIGTSGRSRP